MLKLDDVKLTGSSLAPGWPRVANHLAVRGLKSSMGIIGASLAGDSPVYFDWIKQQAAGGSVEFWNHGYTHIEGEFTRRATRNRRRASPTPTGSRRKSLASP